MAARHLPGGQRAPPSHAPRTLVLARGAPALAWRAAELVALFVGLPLLVRNGALPGPRLLVLAAVTAGTTWVLLRDGLPARALWAGPLRGEVGGLLARTAVAAAAILALALWLSPDRVLAMPRERPQLWLAGLVLYPLLSAWPQELLYRVFFFRRYAALFPTPASMIAASGLAFALLHLVYPNLVAPLLSLPAGLVLAWRYHRAGTVGPVWAEHAVYGLLLFTLGLGNYFYDGRG